LSVHEEQPLVLQSVGTRYVSVYHSCQPQAARCLHCTLCPWSRRHVRASCTAADLSERSTLSPADHQHPSTAASSSSSTVNQSQTATMMRSPPTIYKCNKKWTNRHIRSQFFHRV